MVSLKINWTCYIICIKRSKYILQINISRFKFLFLMWKINYLNGSDITILHVFLINLYIVCYVWTSETCVEVFSYVRRIWLSKHKLILLYWIFNFFPKRQQTVSKILKLNLWKTLTFFITFFVNIYLRYPDFVSQC